MSTAEALPAAEAAVNTAEALPAAEAAVNTAEALPAAEAAVNTAEALPAAEAARPSTSLRGREHMAALTAAVTRFGGCVRTAEAWGAHIADVLTARGRLLVAGNGGSAAQAQHLTAELVGRYRDDRPPYSAICLSAETSSLTAIMNDYPAEELFARQVEAHGRTGDVLVLLSTSGRSPNAVEAARRARALGLTVLVCTGQVPNPLAAVADDVLAVDSPWSATVQELHLVALHLLCAAFDAAVMSGGAPGAGLPINGGDSGCRPTRITSTDAVSALGGGASS